MTKFWVWGQVIGVYVLEPRLVWKAPGMSSERRFHRCYFSVIFLWYLEPFHLCFAGAKYDASVSM